MRLTPEDQTWLEAYRQALARQFPTLVQHLILFGSKARGTATADADLDLLVVIQQSDWRLKEAVTEAGYRLAIDTDVVPAIIVLTPWRGGAGSRSVRRRFGRRSPGMGWRSSKSGECAGGA